MRLLINLLMIVLVFSVAILFFNKFIPAYKKYSLSTQNKNEAINRLTKLSLLTTSLNELLNKDEIKQIYNTQKKGYFDFYLPKKFSDYEMVILINSIFRSNGFPEPNIFNFTQEKISLPNITSNKILKIKFSFSQTGKYEDIIRLIKSFEEHSRLFDIDSVTLSLRDNNLVEAVVNISTYSLE